MGEYRVVVEKDYLVFAAGHFITYGGRCEALHGHNYRVRVELDGELDANAYVFDFTMLKQMTRRLLDELDHKMLLPLENPVLELHVEERTVRVAYEDRHYAFPRSDVVLLPIPNTTAEMLAHYLAGRLEAELRDRDTRNLNVLTVEVEESFGQSASYRKRLRG